MGRASSVYLQSTVVNLLENFYAPQRGQILLDGTPLDAIDHEYLHSQISLVSQEPVLFAGIQLWLAQRDCATGCLLIMPPSVDLLNFTHLHCHNDEVARVCLQRASASTSCSVCRQARK